MDIFSLVQSITFLSIVKLLLLILLLVYTVFAGLMTRQITAMTRAVMMKDDFVIRGLGLAHFGLAVLIFLMALFIL